MSDDEEQINPKSHKQLLKAISSLGKTQHIRKSTRDEPKLVQDEFQLVKGLAVVSKPKAQPVAINDLVQVLKGNKKLLETGKELKKTVTTKKVLEKPLEKPAAERIKRTIGYENVKAKLAKWDAVVASNRSAETQVSYRSFRRCHKCIIIFSCLPGISSEIRDDLCQHLFAS